ncbi:MAG: histidine phosphatase family protein [Pyrinomonadaceae bacterium]|nr:histidine phosphatase family protein [Pyrinomonadaceae bacterium]
MKVETHLYLIRHGQSQGNAERRFGGHWDTKLSDFGRLQAEVTGQYLARKSIKVVYSSDLSRAFDTAKPLADILKLKIETSNALRERNVGIFQGLTFEEAESRFPKEYAALSSRDFDYVLPEGESRRETLARASRKLNEIIEFHKGENVAVFSHTGTIGMLILHLLGALQSDAAHRVWVLTRNCGIAHFEFDKDSVVRVHTVNDVSHLRNLAQG